MHPLVFFSCYHQCNSFLCTDTYLVTYLLVILRQSHTVWAHINLCCQHWPSTPIFLPLPECWAKRHAPSCLASPLILQKRTHADPSCSLSWFFSSFHAVLFVDNQIIMLFSNPAVLAACPPSPPPCFFLISRI